MDWSIMFCEISNIYIPIFKLVNFHFRETVITEEVNGNAEVIEVFLISKSYIFMIAYC